jgi:alkylation response protein AidB-like acyl-CoA dehydrogenase
VEDIESFRARAQRWLSETVPQRAKSAKTHVEWGVGPFDVTVFHDREHEEELRYLSAYVEWISKRATAGFWALTWPVSHGGQGLTKAHERAYVELEKEFEVPNDHELISVTTKLIAPAIRDFGSTEQRELYMADFLHAREYACQLFSEPAAGSDLAGLTMKAVRDGDDWVLDGQKVWTSNAHIAPWGFAICRTDPDVVKHAGLTAFLIPLGGPGIEIRPIRQMNGGASFNEVFFSNARLHDNYRVGGVGDGWKVAMAVLGFERESSGSSGQRGGDFQDVVALARHVGRTNDPGIRQSLARVYSSEQVRVWTRARSAAKARAGVTGPEGSLGKLMWSESMKDISALASTLLGPALTADTGEWGTFDWNQHILGAPGYRIAGGSDEIQRNIIGERVLGLPGEPRMDRDVPFNQIGKSGSLEKQR